MNQALHDEELKAALTAAVGSTYVQGGIKRTVLQKAQFPEGHTINFNLIEVPAGNSVAPHVHPGLELTCVLEGASPASPTAVLRRVCLIWLPIRMFTSHAY